jgi:MFS family permease
MATGVDPKGDAKSLSGETLRDMEHPHSFVDDHSGTTHPRIFKSTWREIIFVVSVSVSRSLFGYSLIGFPALLPTLVDTFHLEGASSTWLVSAVPLVLSTSFIPLRRLAERVGILLVFQCGLAWTLIWTLFAGTSTSYAMLIACRTMQGLGGAAHFLSGAALLSSLYSPGVRRDRAFFLYESMELLGSFLGILVAGLSSQYLSWQWYFWVAAVLALQALIGSSFTAPESIKSCGKMSNIPMDWLGCITTASALMLTVCWIVEFPHAPQGWRTPYLLAIEVLSIASLGLAIYVEGWVAKNPLLPLKILETRGVGPLLVGLFFGYGAIGLYVLYAIL